MKKLLWTIFVLTLFVINSFGQTNIYNGGTNSRAFVQNYFLHFNGAKIDTTSLKYINGTLIYKGDTITPNKYLLKKDTIYLSNRIILRVKYTDTAAMLSPYSRNYQNLSALTNFATARTNLGATTIGANIFTATNPSAITFLRANVDNTVSFLNASDFRTAIGAGTGNGDALVANPLSQFAQTTSLQLLNTISNPTGTGLAVFGTAPTFTTTITTPLIIGGTSTTQTLTYRTTTGVGATGASHIFQVGNNGATEAMRILNNGNIGISNITPDVKFQIGTGSYLATALTSSIPTAFITPSVNSAHSVFILEGNGNGTASLVGVLALRGNRDVAAGGHSVANGVNDNLGIITFEGFSTTTGVARLAADIRGVVDAVQATTLSGRLIFSTTNTSGTSAERMRISSEGLVGIGVTPTTRLHVADATATTALADNILTFDNNSTGTPTTNYGSAILSRLKSSTTTNQDASRIVTSWNTATHASRTSALSFELVTNAGSLSERMRLVSAIDNTSTTLYVRAPATAAPSAQNFNIRVSDSGTATFNGVFTVIAQNGNAKISMDATTTSFGTAAPTSGAINPYSFTTPAATTQTAGAETIGFLLDMVATTQHASSTTINSNRDFSIRARTHGFQTATGTITNAYTLHIDNAPIVGTNAAITNRWALGIAAGNSGFGGNVMIGSITTAPTEKLTVAGRVRSTNSDIVVETDTRGLILKSANGKYWRLTVGDTGILSTTDLGTTLPAE